MSLVLMGNVVGFFAFIFFRLSVGDKCCSNTSESLLMKMPARMDLILVITVSRVLVKQKRSKITVSRLPSSDLTLIST